MTERCKTPTKKKSPARKKAAVRKGVVRAKKKPKSKTAGKSKSNGQVGRNTKYFETYPEEAKNLCLLGATDSELAEYFGIGEATLNRWKLEHPEFRESIRAGKVYADAQVAGAIHRRAVGYSYLDSHVSVDPGAGVVVTAVEKVMHPDVNAAKFWLKNRRKDEWRENYGLTDGSGGALGIFIHESPAE